MKKLDELASAVANARHIAVLQADNPDADSLASALALEDILEEQGKRVTLYCGANIPSYLSYIPGWDRVVSELPAVFDLAIIVDTSSWSLFETLSTSPQKHGLHDKTVVVLDHHDVEPTIPGKTIIVNRPMVATGELLYHLCEELGWKRSPLTNELIVISILADSLGLMSEATTAQTLHLVGDLVAAGVNLAELDAKRRETSKKSPELVHYKGELLQRVAYADDNRIAYVTIPWPEIEKYSPLYNPSMLVLDDMRQTENTQVAIAFKTYPDGKITAKIRCNYGIGIAGELAKYFGGGGHPYAAGFKVQSGKSFETVKTECLSKASELLATIKP